MATKKKAAKKTIKGTAKTRSVELYIPNVIPLCIEVESADGLDDSRAVALSRTGKRFPNSVYWLYKTPPPSGTFITLPGGYFLNQPADFNLPVDPATGRTGFNILDPFSNKPTGLTHWDHNHSVRGTGAGGSGGGIIIQD